MDIESVEIGPWKAWHDVTNRDSFKKLFIYVFWFPIISFALIGYLSIHIPHHLHYTWLGCIKSYIEDHSHRFLVDWWVIHNWFVYLGNPFETIVYYLLIGGMACLGRRDGFPMVSALVHVMHTRHNIWWIMTLTYQFS